MLTGHCLLRCLVTALLLACLPFAQADNPRAIQLTQADVASSGHGTFDVPPLSVSAAGLSMQWTIKALPHVMPRDTPQAIGEAADDIVATWYRLRPPSPASGEDTYLYLPRWQTIGYLSVYKDGKLFWRSSGGPVWNGFNHPVWLKLAERGEAPPHEILIRMDALRSAGGALSSVWIGTSDELRWRYQTRNFLQVTLVRVVTGTFLIVGLFCFAVWLRRRKEVIYAWFAATGVVSWLRYMHFHTGIEPLPIPEAWFGWMTAMALGWQVVCVYFFAFRLHRHRFPRLERGMLGFTLMASIATLPGLVHLDTLLTITNLLMFTMAVLATSAMLYASWKSRSREGLAISLWTALNVPVGLHDLLLQNYAIDIELPYLMPYTILGTFLLFIVIMLNRYTKALDDAGNANARLEARLRERELELEESHRKLREAERQQMIEQERQRLMRDMHDGIGTSLMMALAAVEKGKLDEPAITALLRDCIDDLKLTIDSMGPVDSDLLFLLAALRVRLAQRFSQAGLTLHWQVGELPGLAWLDPASALQIMRILQEAFANVIKHAQATEIRVTTGMRDGRVFVAITDDGKGFSLQDAEHGQGHGLINVRHRAKSLGGEATWVSSAAGTCFELWLPLARPSAHDEFGNPPIHETTLIP